MNIKFGMDNYYVRYLKRFLNHELGISNRILGDFDKSDLKSLITYLNLPNVKDMFNVQNEVCQLFPQLLSDFNVSLKDNELLFTAKQISIETAKFIKTNLQSIRDYCTSVGWEILDVNQWVNESFDINEDGVIDIVDLQIVTNIINGSEEYSDEIVHRADVNLDGIVDATDYDILFDYYTNNKLYIQIKQSNRKNYFPNEDMKVFINQFDGTFMYNYAIRDEGGPDDKPHPNESQKYKIGLYLCRPNQKVTIAHNSPNTQRLVIGSSKSTLLENVENDFLDNVVDIELKPGEGYEYTCTDRAVRLCIQCASSYKDLDSYVTRSIILNRGDVNLDGKIDMEDYALLADYTAEGPGSELLPYNKANWTPTARQLAVMDIPIPDSSRSGLADVDGKITRADAIELYRFITGTSTQVSLGTVTYEYTLNDKATEESNNVSQLLIIDGHYDKKVNIPFEEFTQDPWIIHEKFFNYLLNMSIHKYSNGDDIAYLQKLIKAVRPDINPKLLYPGMYDEEMRLIVKDIQTSQSIYTVGDLNKDGKIDAIDLTLEREIIECLNADINGDGIIDQMDFDLLNGYLHGTLELTPEQLSKADINFDGVIDYTDLSIIQEFIDGTRKNIMQMDNTNRNRVLAQKNRADINRDGKWNGDDYSALKNEIDGVTSNLVHYNISFMLGWCDVETEALLEQMYNLDETISEVSK